ncbi:hypothetical protein BJV77DRAFT_958622 [Russula vinacea]|nr:hypothetical protein BJV77DRAFT_958622 [Russula vinacea]
MRSTAFTAFSLLSSLCFPVGFFSEVHIDNLFNLLFAAVVYAAPAAPQGAISLSTSSSGLANDAAPVIHDVITNLLGLLNNTPGAPQPTAATASESSSAPTTQPTGTPQSPPTIR